MNEMKALQIIFQIIYFLFSATSYTALNDAAYIAITSHPRSACDSESLCNGTVFISSRAGVESLVYFGPWNFPPFKHPNLTITQCNPPPDNCPEIKGGRDIVCLVDSRGWRNSLPLLQHFPHAAELLLPCWNYFTQCTTAASIASDEREVGGIQSISATDVSNDTLIMVTALAEPVEELIKMSAWVQTILKVTGIQVYDQRSYHGNHSDDLTCATTYVKGDRFISDTMLNNWGISDDSAGRLRTLFGIKKQYSSFNSDGSGGSSALRIGILNRKGRRQIDNADELMEALLAEIQKSTGSGSTVADGIYSKHKFTAEHVTMDGKTLVQQIQWVSEQQIIIAPHGAQNTNLAFIRPCTVVIEIYTSEFFIPQYYMPLVTMVGGLAYVMVDLPSINMSPFEATAKLDGIEERRRARNAHIVLDVAVMLGKVLPEAINAHLQCIRDRKE